VDGGGRTSDLQTNLPVLVVDDEAPIRAAVCQLLSRMGMQAVQAASPTEAIAALAGQRFALLITDLNMGSESGMDLTRHVGVADPELAVLMLTGVDDPQVAQEALELGVFGYLVKPFQLNELRIAVMNALRRRELEMARRRHLTSLEGAVAERTAALSRTAQELAAREGRFRALANSSPMGVLFFDRDGCGEYLNHRASQIFGRRMDEVVGASWFGFADPADRARLEEVVRSVIAGAPKATCEHRILHADGTSVWTAAHVGPVALDGQTVIGYVAVLEDIRFRKELEQRLNHQATHDHLTGLANRRWLEARLEFNLAELRGGWELGVAVVDLDQFKLVNDTYGHACGDELIVKVAARLTELVGSNDEVARFGGDEFVIMLKRETSQGSVRLAAEALHAALCQRVSLRDADVYLAASIGLAVTSDSQVGADTLLRNADIALHRAKDAGRNVVEVFDDRLRAAVARQLAVATDLRRDLERGTLHIAFQPQVDALSARVVGFEGLARWTREDGETVSPEEFIPIAESAGLIQQVDNLALTRSCEQLASWQRDHQLRRDVSISVNVSARQLNDLEVPRAVEAALSRSGIAPSSLILELTETVVMTDVRRAQRILERLRELGVRMAIDDFGSGYSSLNYLRQLPVDFLKIDRAFIAGLSDPMHQHRDQSLVAAIVAMAHHLGLTVVAEGVENRIQAEILRSMGCDMLQGFYLAQPMLPDSAELEAVMVSGSVSQPNAVAEALTPAVGPAEREPGRPQPSVGERGQVLVVDDDTVQRTAYRRVLERAGFTVRESATALEALAIVQAQAVDAVVIDNHMPGMSGLEFLVAVRADPRLAGLAVLFATGTSLREEMEAAARLGVTGQLMKPVDLDELVRCVGGICDQAKVPL
jgi:diguanylate cyclase (GGDEF)-like protein/PAS domain S-box-containing protein